MQCIVCRRDRAERRQLYAVGSSTTQIVIDAAPLEVALCADCHGDRYRRDEAFKRVMAENPR